MNSIAPINRILKSGFVDGPGNRGVVFVQGCNFDCPYCHNPETISLCDDCGVCVSVCPAGALSVCDGRVAWKQEICSLCDACIKRCSKNSSPRARRMRPSQVLDVLADTLVYIRGITVSGGECTLYPEFLRALGAEVRARGRTFLLDSNGSYDFAADSALLEVVDGVMLDIKASAREHPAVSGRAAPHVLDRAAFLAERGKLPEVRTVVSPGLFDAAVAVEEVCRRLAKAASPPRYKLIRYRPIGVRRAAAARLREPDEAHMRALAEICDAFGIQSVIA
ncbi:MAG: YjjW family glycine radical enzyme activase [Clostridiales Family XIII bacterium]|nr:YjjW family glycine radical enzyme activase [Clostridiales Family XIII bacterium]